MHIKRHHQGSIIVEVLIAASIFAVALFALLEFQTNLLQNRAVLSQETEALASAQDKLGSFRSYTSLATTAGQFAYADITNGSSTNVGLTATFTTNWTVTNFPDTVGAFSTNSTDFDTRKVVRIVVSWTDPTGIAHTSTVAGATNSAVYLDGIIAALDPAGSGASLKH